MLLYHIDNNIMLLSVASGAYEYHKLNRCIQKVIYFPTCSTCIDISFDCIFTYKCGFHIVQ